MRVGFPLPITVALFLIMWVAVYIGIRYVLPSLTKTQVRHLVASAIIGVIALVFVFALFGLLGGR